MTSPKSRNSNSVSSRRARRSPTVHQARTIPSSKKRHAAESRTPFQYVNGLKARERVDMVLAEMHEKHRWSIKDFVHHLVTAESTRKYQPSCSGQAKTLLNAIYQQEEVVQQLSNASEDIRIVGNTELITRLRTELHAVGKPEVGLGEFDSEKEIGTLDIPALAERIQKAAPELWAFLAGLMEQQYTSRRDTLTEYQGSMVMVCSILAHHVPQGF